MNGNGEVVKALLIEIDGNVEKLRKALREGGVDLEKFQNKAQQSNTAAGRGADALASRQANAARTIAMTTETMARQGKITGETAKQGIAAASNMAFAFGPQGALVGAIGISTLAIVSMFNRVKAEAAEASRVAAEEFRRIQSMDLQSIDRERARLESGSHPLNEDLASSDPAIRAEAERIFRADRTAAGLRGLAQERARQQEALRKEEERVAPFAATMTLEERAREGAVAASIRAEIAAIEKAVEELEKKAPLIRRRWNDAVAEATDRARSESNRMREEGDDKAGKEATRNRDAFLRQTQEAVAADETRRLQQFFVALTQGFEGTREDIEKSFAEVIDFATQKGDQAAIPVLTRARDQALELADLLKANQELIAGIETGDLAEQAQRSAARDRNGPHEAAIVALERQRDAALAIHQDATRADKARADALALAKNTQAQINGLIREENQERKDALATMREQALAIGQAIDGVLQLAAAWGGVSRGTTDVLRGMVQIGANLPSLLKSFGDFQKARDGKLTDAKGNLISAGAAAVGLSQAALPVVGALATIAGTLFGGESPAERERKRVQKENTRALEDLSRAIGLMSVDLSGTEFGAARSSVQALMAGQNLATRIESNPLSPNFGRPVRGYAALEGARDNERIDWKALRAEGVDRRAMEEAAKALNITLDNTVGSFRRLQAAIAEAEGKLAEFGDGFDDQRTVIDAKLDARQITDPIERITAKLAPAQAMSPVIRKLLEGKDLSRAEDRDAIRKEVLAIIETMEAGGDAFTDADLGGLTPEEFWNTLMEVIGGVNDLDAGVAKPTSSLGGVSGFRGLTEAAGERIGDYLKDLNALARRAEAQRETTNALLAAQLAVFMDAARAPLRLPAIPGFASASPGAITVNLEINLGGITVQVPADADPVAAGTMAGQAAVAAINDGLHTAIVGALKRVGDTRVNA